MRKENHIALGFSLAMGILALGVLTSKLDEMSSKIEVFPTVTPSATPEIRSYNINGTQISFDSSFSPIIKADCRRMDKYIEDTATSSRPTFEDLSKIC